ncbi:MAG: hypothetical protein J0H64_05085 [Actinobacteria bacterium]|nr:hypothetical protein [Actinomycetota bacterium]
MSVPVVVASSVATALLASSILLGCDSIAAKQRLDGAADSAALAAADASGGWIDAEPCVIAGEVLTRMEADLLDCRIDDVSGRVRISAAARTMLGTMRTHVQAGPPFT